MPTQLYVSRDSYTPKKTTQRGRGSLKCSWDQRMPQRHKCFGKRPNAKEPRGKNRSSHGSLHIAGLSVLTCPAEGDLWWKSKGTSAGASFLNLSFVKVAFFSYLATELVWLRRNDFFQHWRHRRRWLTSETHLSGMGRRGRGPDTLKHVLFNAQNILVSSLKTHFLHFTVMEIDSGRGSGWPW